MDLGLCLRSGNCLMDRTPTIHSSNHRMTHNRSFYNSHLRVPVIQLVMSVGNFPLWEGHLPGPTVGVR